MSSRSLTQLEDGTLKCRCEVTTSFLSFFSFCKEVLVLHISALLEIVMAAILTLLLSDPTGSLAVRSCRTQKLSDWYTLLHNPSPNYDKTLHCTQEAVYPLYVTFSVLICLTLLLSYRIRSFRLLQVTFLAKKHCSSVHTKH